MKITKKILATMLGLTILVGIPQCASANVDTTSNYEVTHMPSFVQVYGQVKEKNDKQIHINNSSNINNDILLNVSEKTIIIDAVSGLPVPLKDVNLNETIYAYTSPIMTLSLPPISNAEAIIVNIPQDFGVPNYIEVQSINKNYDGSITVTSGDGVFEATLDSTTNIFPYLTRNLVTINDIRIGSTLFLWNESQNYEVQIPENSQKLKVRKCLIMPYSYSSLIEASINDLNINGNDIKFLSKEAPFMKQKVLMVPLEVIAETCGYNVNFDKETSVATMTKEGSESYSVTIDSNILNLGDNKYYLTGETMLKNNTIFVSSDLFKLAQNAKVVVK